MKHLLALSGSIDRLNAAIGRASAWLILAAIAISAGNAAVRKVFDTSSNAWLEIQWWLFAAVFLFAAPWTFGRGEHIRIDIVSAILPAKWRDAIDIAGHLLFLLPMAGLTIYTSWTFFITSWRLNEQGLNAGGLAQWPVKAIIPAAFALLFLQGVSELIKRAAIVRNNRAR